MKIYTKKGDTGTTSLVGGARVSKDDPRVEAYGTVDELSAHIALLRDRLTDEDLREDLLGVLGMLMYVEASLAGGRRLDMAVTGALENRIDELSAELPPLTKFTLPGGHPEVSQAHVCRTVCRRAERRAIAAKTADTAALACLNRLSDYLYVLGRTLSLRTETEEIEWRP